MSQHPSLRSGGKQKRHRSVLKRHERLKHMKEKDEWDEQKSSIFGLPKIKVLKFKVKKEKPAEEVAAAPTPEGEVEPKVAAEAKGPKEKPKEVPKKEKK